MPQTVTLTISVHVPWWIKRIYMPGLIAAARLGVRIDADRIAKRVARAAKIRVAS